MTDDYKIKYIRPSSFYYWQKCPLKGYYSSRYRNETFFPKNIDSVLGSIIHEFYSSKRKWKLNDSESFEKKWDELITYENNKIKSDPIQNQFYPIEWHSKYYAVKRMLLKINILKTSNLGVSKGPNRIKYEKWFDDGECIGGYIDLLVYEAKDKIIELVDFKTGNIFEWKKRKKNIKLVYKYQMALYGKMISLKQNSFPNLYLQDLNNNSFKLDIDENWADKIYSEAKSLKHLINCNILNNEIEKLAVVEEENCSFCDFRPRCTSYKDQKINDFSSRKVDLYGEVENVGSKNGKSNVLIRINNRSFMIENINSVINIKIGEYLYFYNVFKPKLDSDSLYFTKFSIILNE